MNKRFTTTAAVFLAVVMLVAPLRVYAIPVAVVLDPYTIANTIEAAISAVSNTLTGIATPLTAVATVAKQVNDYVLQPIAFIKSGALLKALTAGVIAYVNGKANGTGAPQFVQNLQGNLQRVGDTQALAFFAQYSRNSNSPFASSITSALRVQYLQQTSAAGFWAANRSTLGQYSPNVNGFLTGNWSQGGVGAWLALTTQSQNNPYMLYQNSQRQLASVVGSAQAARTETLKWGQGFLSWCGAAQEVAGPQPGACSSTAKGGEPCTSPAGVPGTCAVVETGNECIPKTGVNPGDSCYQSDGTAGQIKTPGAVITASLNKALGGGQDKLTQIGNIGAQFQGILGSIATIMGTINLAKDILNGPSSGGLAGAGSGASFQSTSARDSSLIGNVNQNYANSAAAAAAAAAAQRAAAERAAAARRANGPGGTTTGTDLASRITRYETAWASLKGAADTAKSAAQALSDACTTQVTAAQTAIITQIAPVLASAASAATITTTARSAIAAGTATENMQPTLDQVASAENDAASPLGETIATPPGSLTVSGGSVVDRMILITSNAAAIKNGCASDSGG